jgi:hypothetical protein
MNGERRLRSRLPDDTAYWDDLAARSIDAAFATSPNRSPARLTPEISPAVPWWRGLSDAAYVLAAGAVLAVVGGSMLLQVQPPRVTTDALVVSRALAPDDQIAASLVNIPPYPPSPSVLVRLAALRERQP